MGRRWWLHPRQHALVQHYTERVEALEREMAAIRNATGQSDPAWLRRDIHALIREMEKHQQPEEGRYALLGRARAMLRDLPARDMDARREHRAPATALPARDRQRMRMNALKRDVKAAEAEVSKLIGERDHPRRRPSADLALAQRAASVDARLSSLAEDTQRHCGDSRERAILLARIQRAHSSLRHRTVPASSRKPRLVRQPYGGRSGADRCRQAVEADRRTREDDVSVRTVSGGLPGLGKRY